jgi:hypothetical protein
MNGKGMRPMLGYNQEAYEKNYDAIFRKDTKKHDTRRKAIRDAGSGKGRRANSKGTVALPRPTGV